MEIIFILSSDGLFLKVHAYIISYLKKEMPSLFGREKKKEELIMNLPEIYTILQREHHISPGDFPNVTKMQVEAEILPCWNPMVPVWLVLIRCAAGSGSGS